MSTTAKIVNTANDLSPELRDAMRAAHMVPLWESPTAHKLDIIRERPAVWPWHATRPILVSAGECQSPTVVERRVLSLVNPKSRSAEDEATTGAISAAMQMLLPGERARPHRHSMNALRFVLEGSGAETIVDGKSCPMEVGDLVITPAWCWHEHVNSAGTPTMWLDVLDVALHLFLATDAFQPGPVNDEPVHYDDQMFTTANMLPCVDMKPAVHSPVFRYAWGQALDAVHKAPVGPDRARRVRYVNPLTGGPCMPLLDCYLIALEPGVPTRTFRTNSSAVCTVVGGTGSSTIGDTTVAWSPKDIFTLPYGSAVSHRSDSAAYLFMVTNRDVYARLGVLEETYLADRGDEPVLRMAGAGRPAAHPSSP